MNEKQINYLKQAGFEEMSGYFSLRKKNTTIATASDDKGKVTLQFFVVICLTDLQSINKLKKEIGEAELIIEIFNELADK